MVFGLHRCVDLTALELDPERAELVKQIFALNGRVHDEALSIAGPLPYPSELTMQQVRVLGFVAKEPGLTGHDLGVRLGVSAPTASGLVERLVEKGLVSRVDDPEDRRVRRLHLTTDGQDLIRRMDSLMERAMLKVIQMMTLEDLEQLRQGSQAMLAAMMRAKEAGL